MNQLRLYFAMAMVAVFGILSTACSSDGEENTNTETSDTTTTRTLVISVDDIEKVGLTTDAQFSWSGTEQKLYVFFKSGSTTATATGTVKVPSGWTTATSTTNPITISVTVPSAFTSLTDYSVSGAFGVSAMDASGNCTVAQQTTTGTSDYTIPFYFPLTTTSRGSDGNDYVNVHFNRYGSLIRVALTPSTSGSSSVTFKNIHVYTGGLFSTQGKFNINTSSTPTYTASDSYVVSKVYTVDSSLGAATSSSPKYAFIWVKANTSITSSSTVTKRTAVVEATPSSGTYVWRYRSTRTSALADGDFYKLTPSVQTGELIISETVFITASTGVYVEVYNPTNYPVPLSLYDLYSVTDNTYFVLGGEDSNFTMYTQSNTSGITNQQPTVLEPKGVMVFASYSITGVSSTDRTNAFGGSSTYTYYRDASNQNFGNYLVAGNFYLRYNNSSVDYDVAQKYGVVYYSEQRKSTNNTRTTTWSSSNWNFYSTSAAGAGGTLGAR